MFHRCLQFSKHVCNCYVCFAIYHSSDLTKQTSLSVVAELENSCCYSLPCETASRYPRFSVFSCAGSLTVVALLLAAQQVLIANSPLHTHTNPDPLPSSNRGFLGFYCQPPGSLEWVIYKNATPQSLHLQINFLNVNITVQLRVSLLPSPGQQHANFNAPSFTDQESP